MHPESLYVGEQFAIERLHVVMVGDVLVEDGHLATADAGADVGHAVVVADCLMLVIWVRFAGLGGIPEYAASFLLVGAYEGAAAGGGDHLVAVEGEHAEASERAEHLTVETRAETLGGILDYGNVVFFCHGHDLVNLIRHTVEGHRDDGLGFASGLFDAVGDGAVEQYGVDVPAIGFGVDEYRSGAKVGYGV